jgi:hypothetical protein
MPIAHMGVGNRFFAIVIKGDPAMLDGTAILKTILAIVLFPTLFQSAFLNFVWGAGDPLWVMLSKRILLLLPVCAIILGCWASVASLVTVPIRQGRREFVIALLMTWWDLGRGVVAFWGGLVKMVFSFVVATLGLVRFLVFALWAIIQDLLTIPFAMGQHALRAIASSPIPWIAVALTLVWCAIETTIFTYVTTPLVLDTFSNITGETLTINMVRIPLALFLFFIVLGSYAVLSTFVDSVRSKSIHAILGIGVIEMVVLSVEVVFLYREFVDSLVPWFAQYSANFELGMFWTLAIAAFAWFGVRSLSWFLFAAHGTPTIMTVIQGKGLKLGTRTKTGDNPFFEVSTGFMNRLKGELDWIRRTGDELVGAMMVPPLQVVAASVNFCTLLVSARHVFTLPLKDMSSVTFAEATTPKAAGAEKPAARHSESGSETSASAPRAEDASPWRSRHAVGMEGVSHGSVPGDGN